VPANAASSEESTTLSPDADQPAAGEGAQAA
jgi:hypothetical protein